LCDSAIELWDFSVLYGWRGAITQDQLFAEGVSKVKWPDSKHNHLSTQEDVDRNWCEDVGVPLSLAFDFAPWFPTGKHIRWEHEKDFYYLAGLLIGLGQRIVAGTGYLFRYGGDWNSDLDTYNQTFMDLGHIELV
jgi:hypothetical protein